MLRLSIFAVAALIGVTGVANAGPQPAAKNCEAKQTCAPPAAIKASDEQVLKSQMYLAATKLGAKGNYRRAAQQLDLVVAKYPNSPVALYTRALAYHNLGNDDLAVRDTSKAISLDPKSANSYFVRGAALQSKGDFTSAIRDYGQVVSLVPDHESAYLAMGTAYFSVSSYERAVASLDKAIEINGKEPTYFLLRGLSNREAGKTEKDTDVIAGPLAGDFRLGQAFANDSAAAIVNTRQPLQEVLINRCTDA
jgi:tetratricopeptide (TPR) repeat protein